MRSLNDIKSWFKTGKFPTETQFSQAWDSFWHKEEKIDSSAVNNLDKTLALKADRELVDSQVNDLRNNKENVGVAADLVNCHKDAQDAHQPLFDLKANDADVYHREVLDERFRSHEEDEELHLQEGEREAWNTHKDDRTVHKTSEQIRSEIVEGDIPATIARDAEMTAAIIGHNESGAAHQDLRNLITGIQDGTIIAKRAEYTEKIGDEVSSYTKPQLDTILNKLVRQLMLNEDNFILTITYQDGTTKEIDFPIEATVKDGRYEGGTNELVLVLVSGQEIRIPAVGLNKIYVGKESTTTSIMITSTGEISADVKQNAIQKVHLSTTLLDEISSYQTKIGDTKDNITTFTYPIDRVNIVSGERLSVLFGKVAKWFSDLKIVAFTGKASDLEQDSVNRFTTDTEKNVWNNKCDTTDPRLSDSRSANGGNADTVDNIHAGTMGVSSPGKIAVYGMDGELEAAYFKNNRTPNDDRGIGYVAYQENDGVLEWRSFEKFKSDLGRFPNPHALTIQVNGIAKGTYDGSSAQTVNIEAGAMTKVAIVNTLNESGEVTMNNHWVFANGAGTASTSDMRFKSNVRDLGDLLDIVLNAPAFMYNWKEEQQDVIGSSAQYWEEHISELTGEMGDEFHTKTLSYERLTIVLIKALQEEHTLREREKEMFEERLSKLEKYLGL